MTITITLLKTKLVVFKTQKKTRENVFMTAHEISRQPKQKLGYDNYWEHLLD